MKKTLIKKAEQSLLAKRTEILSKTNKDLDIDIDGDETDEIQGKIIANIHSQITALEKQKLSRIEKALGKIKEGSFGVCEDCEEDIAEKRLLAYPEYPHCISCAEQQELDRESRARGIR